MGAVHARRRAAAAPVAAFAGPSTGARLQYNDALLAYTGAWTYASASAAGGTGIRYSNTVGNTIDLTGGFSGTGIRINTYNEPGRQPMGVIIDGVAYSVTQSGSPANNFGFVDITGLAAGVHSFRIIVNFSTNVVLNFLDIL